MNDRRVHREEDETNLSRRESSAKANALIAYCLMVVGLFTGFFWLVGAIWAMAKKSEGTDTAFEGHYDNIISTFWWTLGLSILGAVLAYVLIGYLILFFVWIWSIYRIVSGIAKLTSNRPFYD
ncbi:MAG: putative membrane protein [Oceanicoccus sp.]|jgi:uncharacterized membrane protein